MLTTSLIRRNHPWLLGLKRSPYSGEGEDALDTQKNKNNRPLPSLLSLLCISHFLQSLVCQGPA